LPNQPLQPPDPLSSDNRRQAPRRHQDQQLLQRERELQAAQSICQALSQHSNVDQLVERALQTALEVVGAEAGTVFLADAETKQLVFRYVIGSKAELLIGTAIPWDQGLAGAIFKTGRPEVISQVKQDRRHLPDVDLMTGYETRDMIVLPLKRWEGEPIGVLEVINKRNGRLDEDDLSILIIISAITSLVIEQAWLFEKAKLSQVVHRLGDIGHDVKNLLTPVVTGAGFLENLLQGLFRGSQADKTATTQTDQARCLEVVSMLRESVRRVQDRVREIADCVLGLGTPSRFGRCEVSQVIASVLRTLQLLAEEKGIALRSEGLDALPPITADERRLYTAFYNLVNNAIPEIPRGGSITIHGMVEPDGRTIALLVTDTGRGMPTEVRNSLFTNHVISGKPGGTGLGTKIVKDVVDAHGGLITVESHLNTGTTFTIRLPVQQSRPSAS
jgi:signal transduction histidine kinase